MQKLTLESMGLMSRLSRVSKALSLIAVAVNEIHVESVESNAKINIGVNGVDVESFESNAKINIGVNGVDVESFESNAKINIGVNGVDVETVKSLERSLNGYLSVFVS